MNVITLICRTRDLPLDERWTTLMEAKRFFKPNSIDMKHLVGEIERVQFKRLRRDLRKAA